MPSETERITELERQLSQAQRQTAYYIDQFNHAADEREQLQQLIAASDDIISIEQMKQHNQRLQQQLAEHNDDNPNYRHPFEDEPMGHLLAHGQNRNQYTGSEPTNADEPIPYYCAYCGNNTAEHDYDFPHPKEPTTPKPQQGQCLHERLGPSEELLIGYFQACLDCGAFWTVEKWMGWQAAIKAMQGVKDATAT